MKTASNMLSKHRFITIKRHQCADGHKLYRKKKIIVGIENSREKHTNKKKAKRTWNGMSGVSIGGRIFLSCTL